MTPRILRTFGLLLLGLVACPPAKAPQAMNLLKLLTAAVAVQDNVCAATAANQGDADLADLCAKIYETERTNLATAASAVEAGQNGDAVCAGLAVGEGLKAISTLLTERGVKVPVLVVQALAAMEALAPICGEN